MAKARFPGRSLKSYNRKRISTFGRVNYRESEGFRAAEDAYFRLSVFDHLFPEENEAPLFHGFSPHDVKSAVKEQAVHEIKRSLAAADEKTSNVDLRRSPASSRKSSARQSRGSPTSIPIRDKCEVKKLTVPNVDHVSNEPGKKSGNIPAPVVAGTKFVLPSRSAHSSRVIKPNKRFLDSSSPERNPKKARSDETLAVEKSNADLVSSSGKNESSSVKDKTQSPVKFVLHKPKLKINTEPFTAVDGPFSSQSTSLPPVKLKETNNPSTKVICGVCGSVWYWKHVKQARKFGIFSCDPCRRFITKILKAQESKSLDTFPCSTKTGNCTIRQFTLGSSTPFSIELHPESGNASSRCQGCWLNLCLRSYHLASDVIKRLSKYLPPEIPYRPGPPSESKKSGLRSGDIHFNGFAKSPTENTILREARTEKECLNPKGGKGKIKLPISGPRIKHVCRSASLVLGQPVPATFDEKGSFLGNASEISDDPNISSEKSDAASLSSLVVESDNSERICAPEINFDYERPVARMLQDLGKDNCDLLDGMEKHEYEKKFAKLVVDFWESYDPDEVSLSGFPLIGYGNMDLRAVCFLCGSAGLEKLVHCLSCCEAYHTFCASALKSDNNKKDWWKLDWLCPKCTECQRCFKYGGTQLSCANCQASYHINCVASGRANVLDNNWMCPDCLRCKSCHNPEFHVFVGNLPMCNACFNLRKKGNFCPLCQVCYDDNDYDTKMMECAECRKWIHAKCERISDEKYQILSYLPSSIEFVCRVCCKDPPALWTEAVNVQLKIGLLNVIKALGKNQVVCNLVKSSPMKKSCTCRNSLHKPVVLRNLNVPEESPPKTDCELTTSDDKTTDLNLLTPKMTKDDEECLESAKTGLINLVSNKVMREESKNYPTVYDFTEDTDDLPITRFEHRPRSLLSIATSEQSVRPKNLKSTPMVDAESPDRQCTCEQNDSTNSVLTVMEIKKRVLGNHYLSVKSFNEDMTHALEDIHTDSVKMYRNSLKHVFPWFDPDNPLDASLFEESSAPSLTESPSKIFKATVGEGQKEKNLECSWKDLLVHDPDYYYINFKLKDDRSCMFCKEVGEGVPNKEGRLLYCGHNEWVHVNCALWSSEVFEEIDGSLQNVQSAISRSRMIRCCFCEKKGASVGCCARSCQSTYHLSCAINSNCVFLSNKEVYCKNHCHMRGKKDLQNPEDFWVSRPVYVELDQKKRKEILHSEVKLAIGSLFIHLLGEIVPEYSDLCNLIVPCNFKCSRWFWSAKEPWRLVRYFIETRTASPASEYSVDQDINITVKNSSVGITPPPSPRDTESRLNYNCIADRIEIKNLLNQLVDTVCTREEENNLADQQATDLLPPDIEEAIFKDLPHDILDGIDMHDIFPKMNFDDFSECRNDKTDIDVEVLNSRKSNREEPRVGDSKNYKNPRIQKSQIIRKYSSAENDSHNRESDAYAWKTSNILQLDGACSDSSDSESLDSCDPQSMNIAYREDEPVKCSRCRRTYRSSIGFDRHLPECNSDFSSESDSSEDEEEMINFKQNLNVEVGCLEIVNDDESEESVEETYENGSVESQSEDNSCDTQTAGRLDVIVDVYQDCLPEHVENGVTIAEVGDTVNIPQSPAIIVQEVPHETVMPQYMPAFAPQTAIQQTPEIQYFNAPNPNGFHYPSAVAPTVIPSVQPTVLGAIVQSGVDQIVLNTPSSVYHQPPQNNLFIANPSMVVGMETVVSNTVMSSSQFISGVPGMLASSYSTTTTQVFHAAKPQMDMPSNFVVVNAQPVHQPSMSHSAQGLTNLPNFVQDNITGSPWNNYQMNIQESRLVGNNCSSYQTVTRKIVHEQKNVDGVKMINSTQETVVIEPIVHTNAIQQQYNCIGPMTKNFADITEPIIEKVVPAQPNLKPSHPKVVELPRLPTVNREKPQQAVAPVVIKQITSPTTVTSEITSVAPVPIIKKTDPKIEPPISNKTNVQLKNDKLTLQNGIDELANVPTETQDDKPSIEDDSSRPTPPPPPSPPQPDKVEEKDDIPSLKSPPDVLPSVDKDEKSSNPKNGITIKTIKVQMQQSKDDSEQPKIKYEITSEDGFSCTTSDIHSAWEKIFDRVQDSRKSRGLPLLSKNPFADPNSALKKALGFGNNSVKYILEQLPGVSSCTNYRPAYHKKKLSALEQELSRNRPKENYSGCGRTDVHQHKKHTYDMFSWLASRHRRPPKLTNYDVDIMNSNRRASLSLPVAMRFRYLKETSKHTVGVFRSDIHGRGLFCLRDIESGEMVIEYAGEVIRSSLTDMRERFYTAKGIGCYMFRIDDKSVIDATMKGNAARFINHSCEPNCYSKVVDIFGKKHIVIFALRKIIQGEELTYDYKFPLEEDKINCHCLSKRCRKYLN